MFTEDYFFNSKFDVIVQNIIDERKSKLNT